MLIGDPLKGIQVHHNERLVSWIHGWEVVDHADYVDHDRIGGKAQDHIIADRGVNVLQEPFVGQSRKRSLSRSGPQPPHADTAGCPAEPCGVRESLASSRPAGL